MEMGKNIVLLFDGTANTIRQNRTNVLRLHGCLNKSEDQLVWYSPGVGTLAGDRSFFSFAITPKEVFGMMTGLGVDFYAKQAYRFLCEHYDDGRVSGTADRIYMFGFSRGAYIARVLAGFLNAFGMMAPRNLNLLDQAFSTYKGIVECPADKEDWAQMELWHRALSPHPVPIECLGLFDTVSSVFEIGRDGPRFRSHANTSENPSVRAIRHAIALDDRRGPYHPVRWRERGDYFGQRFKTDTSAATPQDIREMWFAGVHSAVGGGIAEEHSGLAKIALGWMITETRALGVQFDQETVDCIVHGKSAATGAQPRDCSKYVKPCALAPRRPPVTSRFFDLVVQSLWFLTGFFWRSIDQGDAPFQRAHFTWRGQGYYFPLRSRRLVRPHDAVHETVAQRQADPALASPNLPPSPNYQA